LAPPSRGRHTSPPLGGALRESSRPTPPPAPAGVVSSESRVSPPQRGVSDTFHERDMQEAKDFIAMKVMREEMAEKFTLIHHRHIMALVQEFWMHTCTLSKTEMASGVKLSKTGWSLLPHES